VQVLPSYSSAFGKKGMFKASLIKRERGRIYRPVFSKPNLIGALLPVYPVSLAMQIFVLFFLVLDLLGVLFYILLVYLGCARCASNEILYVTVQPPIFNYIFDNNFSKSLYWKRHNPSWDGFQC
jgi:hypothetical protein